MRGRRMEKTEPQMPTTLPSPVDRGQFRFVAVDAAGAMWRWIDQEMVWALDGVGTETEGGNRDGGGVVH